MATVCIVASIVLHGGVAAAQSNNTSVEVDLPDEFVVDQDNEIDVDVELSTPGSVEDVSVELYAESVSDRLHPDEPTRQAEQVASGRSSDGKVVLRYQPEEMGPKKLYFRVEVSYSDGSSETLELEEHVEHDRVLDSRIWRGVAMPVPDSIEDDVERVVREDWRFADQYDLEDETRMFWGPTTGDGRLYLLLTPREVEYGTFEMIGSLACYPDEIYYELTEEFLVCFYVANYVTYYDMPDVVLPSRKDLEHGDNVVVDSSVEEIHPGFYEYTGDRSDRDIVFVDHSGVLSSPSSQNWVRGAVLDPTSVPFIRYFYSREYGVNASLYIYPLETVESPEPEDARDEIVVKAGQEDHEIIQSWKADTEPETDVANEGSQSGDSPETDGGARERRDGGEIGSEAPQPPSQDLSSVVTLLAAYLVTMAYRLSRRER